jgi:FkbM family methyltransferase
MAFEPLAELAETLRRSARLQGFSHLQCIELALSDHHHRAVFHRARDGSANSLVPETEARSKRYCGSLEVPVDTLDEYLASAGIDPRRIGLIKVDVEGEETRTVAGMLGTLRRAGFPPVWVEVRGTHGSTRAPNTYPPVRQLLAGLGYEPFTWNEGERRPLGDQVIVGREDVLFLSHLG